MKAGKKILASVLWFTICCLIFTGCRENNYEDTGLKKTSETSVSPAAQANEEPEEQPVDENSMKMDELSESEMEMLEEINVEEGIGTVEAVDPETQEEKLPEEKTTLEIEEGEAGSF